jgi:hypothetical protein
VVAIAASSPTTVVYKRHYGADESADPRSSRRDRTLNPSLPQRVVDRARWRRTRPRDGDISRSSADQGFVTSVVEACTVTIARCCRPHVTELSLIKRRLR